jgi:GTPase SAR1 family protein
MNEIENKVDKVKKHPKSEIFSEVMIILDNSELKTQIEEIKYKFKNNRIMQAESYYIPFLIIISPHEIDLNDFLRIKTFHYKISLENILSFLKGNKDKNEKASDFIRKLNVLFCYYNELGDEFSFINSENKLTPINIEDDTDITIFVNFLLLGKTGVGKSKLINTLLEEMKSIEGGTGFSTTSKKIIVYRKKGYPIRFYDVPGIEDGKSVQNYIDIMEKFKMKEEISYESINAIFYCIEYKESGTIIYSCEKKLFEKLIQFEIPIIFIITKTPYDPEKPASNREIENEKA